VAGLAVTQLTVSRISATAANNVLKLFEDRMHSREIRSTLDAAARRLPPLCCHIVGEAFTRENLCEHLLREGISSFISFKQKKKER
jgi:hypothetical protein